MLAAHSTQRVITTLGMSALIAVAGATIALGEAAAASAQPGIVDVQSGGTVDVDGTQGTIDGDGTQGSYAAAITGDQRALTTQATDSHAIVSDACAVKGGGYPILGCLPPASFDPRTISATTGISNDPNSVLDPDGFQTNKGG